MQPVPPVTRPATDAGLVWLNGELTDFATARIALEDRGFIFGDGVYEVIRAYGGRAFELKAHLTRLARSAAGIELDVPMTEDALATLVNELLGEAGLEDAEIYMQLTRGAGRRNPLFPPTGTPQTLLVGVRPLPALPQALWEDGCRVARLPDERWARCDLKTVCLLPNVLGKERAKRMGAFEVVFVRDGLLTEGGASNVFLVLAGRLVTPRADNRILHGVTRAVVLEIAAARGLEVEARDVAAHELAHAQEAFLTSTRLEVLPITRVDDQVLGDGRPGPVTRALMADFAARTRA